MQPDVEADVRRRARPALRPTAAGASPPARPLKRSPDAPKPRAQLALLTFTVPVTIGAVAGPCSASSASTSDRMPSGYRRFMSCAGGGHVELAQLIRRTGRCGRRSGPAPPPSRAVMPSRRRPPASKVAMPLTSSSACGNESWRMRPFGQQRVAGDHRRRGRAGDARGDFGAAGAANVGEESLQHREVRRAVRLQRQRLIDAGSPSRSGRARCRRRPSSARRPAAPGARRSTESATGCAAGSRAARRFTSSMLVSMRSASGL